MDDKTLRDRLAQLHAELDGAHAADPAARSHLGEVMPDIKHLAEGGTLDKDSGATLPDRLEQVAVKFEAQHPKLAGSVRSLVDLLAEVGI